MNFMEISTLFSGHGFGINTDIFETNVINLAVVIAVVISLVGDALRELLETRKQKILDNISLADARAKEMEDRISQARTQLENAEKRAIEIREQGILSAEREKDLCISQADDEAVRLNQLKDDSIRLQQQKAIQQISRQIVALSVKQARQDLNTKTETKMFQSWVNKAKMLQYVAITENAASVKG